VAANEKKSSPHTDEDFWDLVANDWNWRLAELQVQKQEAEKQNTHHEETAS